MNWLLSGLRNLGKKATTAINTDKASFLTAKIYPDSIQCNWGIKSETSLFIKEHCNSRIFLRIRDASEDGTSACKTIELSTEVHSASIDLPFASGLITTELGYYNQKGNFVMIECALLDFGIKKIQAPDEVNWFTNESKNIHQEMYELAIKGSALGGSEALMAKA